MHSFPQFSQQLLNLAPFFTVTMILRVLLLSIGLFVSSASIESRQTYVVHIDKTKISQQNAKQWYQEIANSIDEFSDESAEFIYEYNKVVFGFAAKLSENQVQALSETDGFLSAIPDEILKLHTTHSPRFLGLETGKGLWNSLNLASDTVIGVLDTGIWPEHVSFQDTGLPEVPSKWKGKCKTGTKFSPSNCNRKIIGARAFYKGYESLIGKINETTDFRSPRDSQGHGSHTASTAAGNFVANANLFGLANGSAAGMMYTARIAVYKVCWASGCTNADLLAAIDQAVEDGVDVLSLSLGGTAKPFYNDNVAIASFGATEKGVFVSCSAGNLGPSKSTVDNSAPWIMTVAASYTDRSFPASVKLGNKQVFFGSSIYSGNPTKQLPVVYAKTAGASQFAKYCTTGSLNPKLVKGKIVICERGLNGRTAKGEQVKLAGGAGMLLINSETQGEEALADAHVLPAVSLGASAGVAIKNYIISAKKPTALISFIGTTYGNPAPAMAAFSSRGPSAVGPEVIKPDVTAPGVSILAAWPPIASPSLLKTDNRSVEFNIISGTSMSCPHVSGLAALLKSVHRDWSPAAIKSALMTTAYVVNNKNMQIYDLGANKTASSLGSATPFALGSGHVSPQSAADPGLIYNITTQDYLNYFCSLNYTTSQLLQVTRRSFSCPKDSGLQPGDLNYPSFAVNLGRNDRITYKRSVTNVGVESCSYVAEIEEAKGVSVTVEPKVLRFERLGQELSYNVSFVGLSGEGNTGSHSFGAITWISGKYKVRSPIAVTWQ